MDHRDIVEIQQLIALYGHAVDADDQAMLPQVFTADAVFDAPFGIYSGIAELSAWFARGKPPHPPSHQSTNVYIYEADGEVRVRSKWMIIERNTGTLCTGDYEDVVVRTGEGWRIARRLCVFRHPSKEEYAQRRQMPEAEQS